MDPRTRSSILWGLVGTLAFLVLVQGYQLAVARLPVSVLVLGGLAVVAGGVVAAVSYGIEHRLTSKGRT